MSLFSCSCDVWALLCLLELLGIQLWSPGFSLKVMAIFDIICHFCTMSLTLEMAVLILLAVKTLVKFCDSFVKS